MDEWMRMEQSLRDSLRHVSAPDGFTDRVMGRVAVRQQKPKWMAAMHVSRAGWIAAAAILIVCLVSGEALHVRHQQKAEAAAQAELDRAMQLTSHAMNEVETGFERSSAGRYAKLWNQ